MRANETAFLSSGPLSNAEIADRLAALAQLLATHKENPYKIKAYQRAAARIRNLPESLDELVREEADLTRFAGIGDAIASAIREIVLTGSLGKLEKLRGEAAAPIAELTAHPRLDPKRVLRVYKKLNIATIDELRRHLDSGDIARVFGARMAQHIAQGLTETQAMLLYRADELRAAIEEYLILRCGVRRAEAAGDYRRRVEVIEELTFVVETDDFGGMVAQMQRYGGRTKLLGAGKNDAQFALSAGIRLRLHLATRDGWGLQMVACTGSKAHLRKLTATTGPLRNFKDTQLSNEAAFYAKFGLSYVEPELREGRDEIDLARKHALPHLVTLGDIRGDLHAHTTASDGGNSIEEMAAAARKRGYEYLGITDHSQSLRIARGVSIEDLWAQLRFIDRLNGKLTGFRILKSAEVDILADGGLDYPDELLRELDYTVCSIHSRFSLDRSAQTERLLRAMDNRYFNILGHATGRLLLKRPGYEIDIERVIEHARQNHCFFEINSSPDRLDLSAEHARLAALSGVMLAISTDAHSTREFGLIRCGLDQARRASVEKRSVLNCQPLAQLERLIRR